MVKTKRVYRGKKIHKDFFSNIHEFLFVISAKAVTAARNYYGAHLGALSQLEHGVSGDVYAVDSRTLFLKNFRYDGEGPGNFNYFTQLMETIWLILFV